jgi:hypothetical protein
MLTALLLMGVLLNRYFLSKLLEMYAVEDIAKLTRVSPKGDDVVIKSKVLALSIPTTHSPGGGYLLRE